MSGSRAGVLNGSMLAIGSKGQVVEGVVFAQVAAEDVLDGGRYQEILLAQAQQLALHMAVVGIKNLADYLGHGILAQGGQVVPPVERVHINAGGNRLPQS